MASTHHQALSHFQGEQAGREMGRGSEVGQTGLQRGVHEQEYT